MINLETVDKMADSLAKAWGDGNRSLVKGTINKQVAIESRVMLRQEVAGKLSTEERQSFLKYMLVTDKVIHNPTTLKTIGKL